MMNTERLTATL